MLDSTTAPPRRPRALRAGLIATVVCLALGAGCTGGDDQTRNAASTSSAPPGSTSPSVAPTSTGPTSQRDGELAAILTRVTVNQAPLEVFPIATVRQAGTASTAPVEPAKCGFAVTGLLGLIMEGKPAAMGISTAGVTITLVDAGVDGEAERVLGQRDTVLDSPECTKLKVTQQGQTIDTSVSEASTSGAGLTRARVLVSGAPVSGANYTSGSLLGRKGTVLVLVNSNRDADVAKLEALATQVVAQL